MKFYFLFVLTLALFSFTACGGQKAMSPNQKTLDVSTSQPASTGSVPAMADPTSARKSAVRSINASNAKQVGNQLKKQIESELNQP